MPLDILVVDDIQASRRSLCALVSELGHSATGADSGRAALDWVHKRLPDLVLVDLLMPELDGFELTRRLRDLTGERWLPVIATSSLEGDEHVIQALRSGADDYLSRPVNPALLEAKLRHYGGVLALQARHANLAQRQRDILDNILDPVLTLDAAGCVAELNRAAQALARLDGQALAVGTPCIAVFGIELAALLAQRECRVKRSGGAEYVAEIGLSEWHDMGAVHYTLVLRDLTERRQIERMKDEFLATVSHELRTPLTSVMGALGLMAGGAAGALPAAALPLAEVARRNGERLGRLIDDILDLTKLEGDRMALHLRPQSVAPLLRECIAANQGYAQRAGVVLSLDLPPDASHAEVPLDADRFLQVMANLLSNAIKHSPQGETVRVAVGSGADGLRITVHDRGPGIAPQFRARMFEKFSQADGTDRRAQGGTGLGLYITRMLVERMGGRISADEVTGVGSAFSVHFRHAAAVMPSLPLVLHVDSDFQARARVARWLAGAFSVEGVASLAQAESAAANQAPSMIIGNPQAQGSSEAFCAGLKRLAAGKPVLLFGDSIDQAFCTRVGLPWLRPARSGADDLLTAVRRALAAPLREGPVP
jgi:signal transduction histidine kinase